MRDFDVTLCGYYGFNNFGDELLADLLIRMLIKSSIRKERIAILSNSPSTQPQYNGVLQVNRWDIKEVFSILRRSQSLLLGGGGLLQDSTSIASCFYYWGIVHLARLAGCKVWAIGQSIGPLRSLSAQKLARNAFSCCSWISVRDRPSKFFLDKWKIQSSLSSDIAVTLELPQYQCSTKKGGVILLNLRPWDISLLEEASRSIALFCTNNDYTLKGIAFSEEDIQTIDTLQNRGLIPITETVLISNVNDFICNAKGISGAIGMRLHFIVLCLISDIPMMCIAYDPKVSSFADQWEIPVWKVGEPILLASPQELCSINRERENIHRIFNNGLKTIMESKTC